MDSEQYPEELRPLVSALKRFATTLSADLTEILFRLNLTMPQIRVLHTIRKEGRMSGRRLAQELGVSPGAIVQVCDRLQEQGYVERVPDTHDRRVTWFQLASSTQDLFEEMLALRRARVVPALSSLSPEDRETLIRILNEMAAALDSERETGPKKPSVIDRMTGGRSLETEPTTLGSGSS
jgi:DNA-binding MarR family transcriptional regulator